VFGDGVAKLGGTLEVLLIDGFVPKVGDTFGFLFAAGGYEGSFDAYHLPALSGGKKWSINPGNSTVFLEVHAGFSADFDGDGDVDAADLAKWQGDHGANGNSDADLDGDSDGADFLAWQRQLRQSLASATSSHVPEPGTACLLFVTTLVGWQAVAMRRCR
jgi:hypothetical protein